MLIDILILFIIVTIIIFFLTLFIIDDKPMIALPLIMIGMIFSVLCTYGMWNVEYFYVGYNATEGNSSSYIFSTMNYGDPYSYIFLLFFFVFVILFFKAGWNMWKEALLTRGEMDYRRPSRRK